MINGIQIYNVVAAIVPLYVPMILAYGSVCWWKIFTPEQCSGINRFVAVFAVPFLNFHFLASNNPYTMNLRFIAADSLQKVAILGVLSLITTFTKCGSLDWSLTLFSLSSLPNTLVVGVPLLTAMYGDSSATLMSQIVVMQNIVWFPLMLFLYELRGAKSLVAKQFPENGGSITSLTLDSDVNSLNGNESLQAHTGTRENSELDVVVRSSPFNNSCKCSTSNVVTGTEICLVQPSMQRASSFNATYDPQNEGFEDTLNIHEDRICRSDTRNGVKHERMDMFLSPKEIRDREVAIVDGLQYCSQEGLKEVENIEEGNTNKRNQMPRASIMLRLILTTVWKNLIRNPNTYASGFGLVWSLISFRWSIKMSSIVNDSIVILSRTGTGMAMFSLGLFMALQPKTVACGKTWAAISMVARFFVAPTVIAVTSTLVGIRGVLLRVAIVQAALPQAIVSFVFAKEYNLHADILSTAVIFGTVISLPVTIIYFVLLGL